MHIKHIYIVLISTLIVTTTNVIAREYKVPPSSTTSSHVPWIPDAEMEQCIKLYNEANWLAEELESTYVDRYNQESVNSYNAKVNTHSRMIGDFNSNCAGKQSESAYKAAQKLNQELQQ